MAVVEVVVAAHSDFHELSHHGHQLSLCRYHLLKHSVGVVVVGITSRRHLWGFSIDEQKIERSMRDTPTHTTK